MRDEECGHWTVWLPFRVAHRYSGVYRWVGYWGVGRVLLTLDLATVRLIPTPEQMTFIKDFFNVIYI